MKPKPMPPWLHHFYPEELLCCATRYFLGRSTIATACFARSLSEAWTSLTETARMTLQRDIEQAFIDDDHSRLNASKGQSHPIGHDCDRDAWQLVRNHWHTET